MNPDTATVAEMCDWLAEKKGWKLRDDFTWHLESYTSSSGFHPVQPTLDAAAAAMPSGDGWYFCVDNLGGLPCEGKYRASAWNHDDERGPNNTQIVTGNTELEARLRLACKCILAEEARNEQR